MQKQKLEIKGPAGNLETVLHKPEGDINDIAVVCHPHPLFAGSMHNKVVTTTVKALNNLGIATVHFNFRGVGASEGEFANAIGEVDDCLAMVEFARQTAPNARIWLAGFSFGSFVAAKVAELLQDEVVELLSIAPPVHHNDFNSIRVSCPWNVIQCDDDEVVPAEQVYAWFESLQANKKLERLAEGGHFFHGNLILLADIIKKFYHDKC